MSIPSLLEVFESGLDGPPKSSPNSTSLESIIRHKLENAVRETYSGSTNSPESPQSCSEPGSVLNEMGDYLTRTASIWARLTQDLMMGSHIDDLAMDAHEQANRETRLSDLSAVVAIDTELGKLRKIRDLTDKYSRDVQAIWKTVTPLPPRSPTSPHDHRVRHRLPSSPMQGIKPTPTPSTAFLHNEEWQSRVYQGYPHPGPISPLDIGSGSDGTGATDEEEQFQNIDMEALRTRGKGEYHCPKGRACTKGGVNKDGSLVTFDRNSAFAQHCNKHRKPYRCNLDGCPNPVKKRRFARRDGLERHQRMVAHAVAQHTVMA